MMATRSARDQVFFDNIAICKFTRVIQDCEEFIMRNFELLRQVKMPMEQEDICKFLCGNPTMQGTYKKH